MLISSTLASTFKNSLDAVLSVQFSSIEKLFVPEGQIAEAPRVAVIVDDITVE